MLKTVYLPTNDFGLQRSNDAVVGMIYGEKDFAGVRSLVKYVLKFALTLTGIFVAFAIFFPQIILSVCNIPETLFPEGATALRLLQAAADKSMSI